MGEETLLGGRYRLIRALGTGGAGHTWLAEDTTTGVQVTVKELHSPVNGSETSLVEREARLLGQIDHPQVPRYVDAFVEEVRLVRRLHLVLAFVEGEPLDQLLARRRLSQAEAVAVLEDVLGVVAALHELAPPVIHRDLKPSNIILRSDGRVALIDFGLAIDAVERTFQHTMAAGTLGYQAPEQIAGDPRPASDVYSVGVLAIAMLTRAEPHTLLDWQTLRWEGAARHLDPSLRGWLQRALDPNPDTRFSNAGDALRGLRNRADLPSHAATSQAQPPAAPTKNASTPRAGLLTLMLAAGSVLVAVGTVAFLAQNTPAPVSAPTPSQQVIHAPVEPILPKPVVAPKPPPPSDAAACRTGSGPDCLKASLPLLAAPEGHAPRDADRRLAFELLALGCMGAHLESCVELAERTEAQEGPDVAARWWQQACELGASAACARVATPASPESASE